MIGTDSAGHRMDARSPRRSLLLPRTLGLGDAHLTRVIRCITGYPLVVGTLTLGVVLGGLRPLAKLF